MHSLPRFSSAPLWAPIAPLTAALLLLGQAAALAEPIEYDCTYEGNLLPDAPEAQPLWLHIEENRNPADSVEVVETQGGQALQASTVTAVESTLYWRVGTNESATGDGVWNGSTPEGSTVDLRVRVEEGIGPVATGLRPGFGITLSDGHRCVAIFFGPKGISLRGAGVTDLNDIDHTEFQNYRIVFHEGYATLYAAGDAEPIIRNFQGMEDSSNSLVFGDLSGYVGGRYQLDYLRWTNTRAEFSPPPASPPVSETP